MSEITGGKAATKDLSLAASHAHCIACGDPQLNPLTLGLRFSATSEFSVAASCRITPQWQGYRGIMHGGIISTLLDAAMTNCLFHQGAKALTAELNVRFMRPVPIGTEVTVAASLVKQRRGVFWLEAQLSGSSNTSDFCDRYATANAKFVSSDF